MTRLLVVLAKQLYFSRKSKKYSSLGGFSFWYNHLLEYINGLHILAPVYVVHHTPKGGQYLNDDIWIHEGVKRRGFVNFAFIKNVFATIRICIKHHIDVVLCQSPSHYSLAGFIGACMIRKKRILDIIGEWPALTGWRKPAFGLLTKFLTKLLHVFECHMANHIIVLSHMSEKGLISLGAEQSKITVAPKTGVTVSLFAVPRLESGKKEKTILFVGRLSAEKGLLDLVESMRILRDQFGIEQVKLNLVGDGPLRDVLKNKVNALKLDNVIRFTGFIPHDKLDREFADSWVFVLPSLTESYGKVVLEAMASGRPVVATRVGAVPENVENGINGFLVEPSSPQALAESISKVLTNERVAIKMGEMGRRKAKEHTPEKILRKYCSSFEKV